MITLKEWIELINYRITGGTEYQWRCFGFNARYIDCDQTNYSVSAIFDAATQEVYQVEVFDNLRHVNYTFTAPAHREKHAAEAKQRNISFDDNDYKTVELEVIEDWLEKAQAIVAGQEYDTRVIVPVTFPDAELLQIFQAAHKMDITFNQFVTLALEEAIARQEKP